MISLLELRLQQRAEVVEVCVLLVLVELRLPVREQDRVFDRGVGFAFTRFRVFQVAHQRLGQAPHGLHQRDTLAEVAGRLIHRDVRRLVICVIPDVVADDLLRE